MEHTVVLGSRSFLDEISPRAPRNKHSTKNGTVTVEDDDGEDEDEPDEDWTLDWDVLDMIPDDVEVDDPVEFIPGDALGKALALINQVCARGSVDINTHPLYRYAHHPRQKNTLKQFVLKKVCRLSN